MDKRKAMVLILVKKEPVAVFNRFDSRSSYSYIHVFVKTLVALQCITTSRTAGHFHSKR